MLTTTTTTTTGTAANESSNFELLPIAECQDGSCDSDVANGPCEYSYRQLLQRESNNKFDTETAAQEMGLESAGPLEETEAVVSVSNKSLKDKTGFMWRAKKQLKATFSVTMTILKYVHVYMQCSPLLSEPIRPCMSVYR